MVRMNDRMDSLINKRFETTSGHLQNMNECLSTANGPGGALGGELENMTN
jgi:hypothetical protein